MIEQRDHDTIFAVEHRAIAGQLDLALDQVRRAGEDRDLAGLRGIVQLQRCADLLQGAVVQYRDAVGGPQRQISCP